MTSHHQIHAQNAELQSFQFQTNRPAGIISDSVVAEADLMTLLSGRELCVVVCLSSPDSSRWRALRAARSLMALGVDGESLSDTPLAAPPLLPLPLVPRSLTSPELPAAGRGERRSSDFWYFVLNRANTVKLGLK